MLDAVLYYFCVQTDQGEKFCMKINLLLAKHVVFF